MKIVYILIILGSIASCHSQNSSEISEIYYEAYTRGSSITIKVQADQIFYNTYDNEVTKPLNEKVWKHIVSLCSNFELHKLNEFTALSDDRTRDLAMHANLKIVTNEGDFKSQTFDHGNPPNELKMLINELFKLAKIED